MTGQPPGALRVTAFVFGLLAVLGLVLVALELATDGAVPNFAVGTWDVPVGVPMAMLSALVFKTCNDAANERDRRAER